MKQNCSLSKATELGISLLVVAIVLVACGGSSTPASTPPPTPTPTAPIASTNQVEKVFTDGLYLLWGFGGISNGASQVFISNGSVKVFGAVNSQETSPRLDMDIPTPDPLRPYFNWTFPASSVQANLNTLVSVTDKVANWRLDWTFTLNQMDISGQTVLSQIKKNDGSLLLPTLVNANAVFPPGSIAYTASYTAMRPTVVDGFVLWGNWGVVSSESGMYGSGWCQVVAGQSDRLGVEIAANGVVLLYQTPTCKFSGLSPIDTGSWVKEIIGVDTIYRVTYPTAITNGVWASAFVNSYDPKRKIPNIIINRANSTAFIVAHDIPTGSSYTTLQPFFNSAALPALRSAAGF